MASNDFGYVGEIPTQSGVSNTGIFSMEDVIDLKLDANWRWQNFPVETSSAQLDIYLDAKLGSYSTSSGAENLANTVYGTSTLGNFAQSGTVGHSTTSANFGGAFIFDGTDDYLYKSYSSIYNGWREGMTISYFLKRDDYNGRQNVFNNAYGGLGTITLETNGSANLYHGTNGNDGSPYQGSNSGVITAIGEVANIVVCRRSATVQWYKNGVRVSSKTNSYPTATDGSNTLQVGRGYAGYFDGMIYNMQVWDGELTEAEILQNYQYFAPRFGMS